MMTEEDIFRTIDGGEEEGRPSRAQKFIRVVHIVAEIALSVYLLFSILSHAQNDPSLFHYNTLDEGIRNMMGASGAYISDLLIQAIGAPCAVCIAIFIAVHRSCLYGACPPYSLPYISSLMLLIPFFSASIDTIYHSYSGFLGIALGRRVEYHINYNGISASFMYSMLYGVTILLFCCTFKLWRLSYFLMKRGERFIPEKYLNMTKVLAREKPECEVSVASSPLRKSSAIVSGGAKGAEKGSGKEVYSSNAGQCVPPKSIIVDNVQQESSRLSEKELAMTEERLMKVLNDFGVRGKIIDVKQGPVVTLYELQPASGTKSSRVMGLSDDVARSMHALTARINVIPGKDALGIELPNEIREVFSMKEQLQDDAYNDPGNKLPLILGKDIAGGNVIADLTKMPHLLIAGTTGSGKSVAINAMILSLLYKYGPDRCKFIMIDPKMLELSVYEGIPHLMTPVVTDPKKAVSVLKWLTREMEDRYRSMSLLGVRNISGYNEAMRRNPSKKVQTGFDKDSRPIFEEVNIEVKELPYIVLIVEEMADLVLVAGKDVEGCIQRLAQMARAAGIHVIMATQRPSVDIVTGVIKANFPTRISFQVSSKIDSRTIIGEMGAEQLLGMGDMLYVKSGGQMERVHGPLVTSDEVHQTVQFIKENAGPASYELQQDDLDALEKIEDKLSTLDRSDDGYDELYENAVNLVMKEQKISTSYIQRRFKIGYNRASLIVEKMEEDGVVSPPNSAGKRHIIQDQGEMA